MNELSRPCSWLYRVPQLGVGTGEIESLTGYVARVAHAHSVTPSDLLHRGLEWWDLEMPENVGKWRRRTCRLRLNSAINGHTTGRPWIELLERLGCVQGLSECSIMAWGAVLPARRLLRPVHAWCPECYKTDTIPYDRLVWSLRAVRACPKHRCQLVERCPECNSRMPALHGRSAPGYCPRCSAELAGALKESSPAHESEINISRLAADFLRDTADDRAARRMIQADVSTGLRACAAAASLPDAAEFARCVNVSRITAWYWLQGRASPDFEHLLGICQAFRVPVLDLLTGRVPTQIQTNRGDELPLRPARRARKRFDAIRVFGAVQRFLEASKEPPSLEDVGREIGFAVRVLRRHFPALCLEISIRHKTRCRVRAAERRAALREEFRAAIRLSRASGGAASRRHAVRLLPKPGVLRSLAARQEFDQLRLELK